MGRRALEKAAGRNAPATAWLGCCQEALPCSIPILLLNFNTRGHGARRSRTLSTLSSFFHPILMLCTWHRPSGRVDRSLRRRIFGGLTAITGAICNGETGAAGAAGCALVAGALALAAASGEALAVGGSCCKRFVA